MAFSLALPANFDPNGEGLAMTFIVPAPQGCDLNCRGCWIAQRKEAQGETILSISNYATFFDNIVRERRVGIMAIQGHEPLLPGSWFYTEALLRASRSKGIASAIVTNGTHLLDKLGALKALQLGSLTVSLDSADPIENDSYRGAKGAFHAATAGIKAASQDHYLRERLTVASILPPKHAVETLSGMPRLLTTLNVRTWSLTPFMVAGSGQAGGPAASPDTIARDVSTLAEIANHHGVSITLDDELEVCKVKPQDIDTVLIKRLLRRDHIVRLSPNGAIASGLDILKRVDAQTAIWDPSQDPAVVFIKRYLESLGQCSIRKFEKVLQ